MIAQIPPNPNGTDLSRNAVEMLCPVGTFDISPVIYRWDEDIQPPVSPVGTIEP